MSCFTTMRPYLLLLSLLMLIACGNNSGKFSTTGLEAEFRSPGPYKVGMLSEHPVNDSARNREFSATSLVPRKSR